MHWEIAEYKLATYTWRPTGPLRAAIGLRDTSGAYVGYIFFYREDYDLPSGTPGDARMYFHISEMPLILDVLRNESPIYFTDSGSSMALGTSTEPIGEGET